MTPKKIAKILKASKVLSISKLRKCKCDFCMKWSPTKEAVEKNLSGTLLKHYKEMMDYFLNEAEDASWHRHKVKELQAELNAKMSKLRQQKEISTDD